MDKLTVEDLELFLVQCWIIWNQRNSVLHNGTLQDPTQLNKRDMDFLEEYKGVQDQLAIPTILGSVQTWTPPQGLVYKLNFDATVFANTNALGFGAIVCNDKGEVIAELSAKEKKTQILWKQCSLLSHEGWAPWQDK